MNIPLTGSNLDIIGWKLIISLVNYLTFTFKIIYKVNDCDILRFPGPPLAYLIAQGYYPETEV